MITVDRRKQFASRELLLRIALAWLVVAAASIIQNFSAIRDMRFGDPDDVLRLQQVRNLLAGQAWFDLHQYRIDPPHGVLMHWSRLVDVPIAGVILLLRPLLGAAGAEQAAVIAVPLLTLFVAQFMACRIAWQFFGPSLASMVALLWMVAVPAMNQMVPLRIDHHGWQIVAVLAAANGLLSRKARFGGWMIGASLAFGLAISLELLPFTALFAGVLGLRWLRDRTDRAWLVHMLQALATCSLGFFLVTRGTADLYNHCDAISPAYLAALILAALLVSGIAVFGHMPLPTLCLFLAGAALASLGGFLLLAPHCTAGPFAQMDPLVRKYWYEFVFEGKPVWHQTPAMMAQMIIPPLVGLYTALGIAGQSYDWLRRFWFEYALLLAGSLVIAIMVARFSGVACALAVVPIGWQLRQWLARVESLKQPVLKIAALAGVVFAVIPGMMVVLAQSALAEPHHAADGSGNSPSQTGVSTSCGMPGSIQALAALPESTIFAPLDLGPAVLNRTRHRVIATSHHRASAAMHDVIEAFISSPGIAQAIVRRHGASYVIACQDLNEVRNYQRVSKDDLTARLLAGHPPAWLQPVPMPATAGTMRVWRVIG